MKFRWWNVVLLFKLIWDIARSKERLWIKCIHAHYLRRYDMWRVTCNNGSFWLWKELLTIRDSLLCQVEVRNGRFS